MARLLQRYLYLLEHHPWKTQCISTGAIMATGDILCQLAVERKTVRQYDVIRTVRFTTVGICYVAPCLRGWYKVLENVFGATGKTVGLKKVIADQLIFAPVFLIGILSVNCFLRDWSVKAVKTHLRKDYLDVLKTNYMVYPGAQIINFYVVPVQLRILFVNCVALVFNTYISYKSNSASIQNAEDE